MSKYIDCFGAKLTVIQRYYNIESNVNIPNMIVSAINFGWIFQLRVGIKYNRQM